MPKTTLTLADVTDIRWAREILAEHTPTRRKLHRRCTRCRRRWGRRGCHLHLWATDYLSQFSRILVPDRPPRPSRRHNRRYIAQLDRATRYIGKLARAHRHACPLPYPL